VATRNFNGLHSRRYDEEVQLYSLVFSDGEDTRKLPLSNAMHRDERRHCDEMRFGSLKTRAFDVDISIGAIHIGAHNRLAVQNWWRVSRLLDESENRWTCSIHC
jgi:hypothetical protein